jgi:class 3 adenylate cyclase/tetratricopeptide (TPR) repeat protein
VECPSCGAQNASARKFCRACGASLPLLCPSCGSANERDDRFCGECGTSLTAPASSAAPASAPIPAPVAPAEERRQVTVLFADLVGFTGLAERLDPEDVRDITTRCLRQLAAEAVRFEGTVDKLIGDAVMILFGAPVAHEDDPARALRAALAMQRALERFNQELERTHGLALRLRIGVETGEVVAGPREVGGMVEYTVIGDAVNVAARLQAAAEPGSVLVGEGTRQRTEGSFRLEGVEPLALKGRERPVAAAVLVAEAGSGPIAEPRGTLVGRSTEMRSLLDRLDALRAGRGGAAVVIGTPGLGKSRLLAELRSHAEGIHWARCQAYAHEHTGSYGLARSLVRSLLGIGAEERDQAATTQLRAVLTALDRADLEMPLAHLLGLPLAGAPTSNGAPGPEAADQAALHSLAPRDLQRHVFEAVVALVDSLAARQPLVLELDDLHWADPTSVDLLLVLLDRAREARVLLCCAFRPESDAACQVLRERGQWHLGEQYVEIALRPLSEAASAELAARLLGLWVDQAPDAEDDPRPGRDPSQPDRADAAPSALPVALRALLERAAGTPLWLEELVRTLVERGVLAEGEDGWQLVGDLGAVELPSSLQALIVARIDRLGAARPTLQIASVIGRRFGRTVLERVAEASGRLDADLSQAQRADLVREVPLHLDREYDFKHVLVRDAAYATLLHRRRRELHRRVAEAVERLYPERVTELHAVLAYHYEHAEVWQAACQHARAAAEAARDGFANREAVESYTLAVAMAERANCDLGERIALLEGRGAVHERLGDFESARADYEAALALTEATPGLPLALARERDVGAADVRAAQRAGGEGSPAGDVSTRIRLLGLLGMLWGGHKDYQRGVELIGQAVDLARSAGDARAQADASVQRGILLLNLMRLAESRQSVEEALALYQRLEDAHGQARTLDVLGLLACLDGRLEEAVGYLEDAYTRLDALGDRGGAVSSAAMLIWPLASIGQWRQAEARKTRAVALAQEIGAPAAESFAWMMMSEALDQYGAFTQADEAAQRALAIAREIQHREWTLAPLGPIGRIRHARGDLAGALAAHQEMLAISSEVGSAIWTVEALANLAVDQLALGDQAAARASADESIAMGGQYQKGTIQARLTRIRLLLIERRPADALAEARATLDLLGDYRARRPEVLVLEGAALAALGRPDEAEAAYRSALEAARSVGAAIGLWQAARALTDLLTRAGRSEEAAALGVQIDAELDALAVDLGEPGLRETLAAQPAVLAPPRLT